jgi:hypothetical protein
MASSSDWVRFVEKESGDTYYHNFATAESAWELPEGVEAREPTADELLSHDVASGEGSDEANPNKKSHELVKDADEPDAAEESERPAKRQTTGSDAGTTPEQLPGGWLQVVDPSSGRFLRPAPPLLSLFSRCC